jgi:hypothetical protein
MPRKKKQFASIEDNVVSNMTLCATRLQRKSDGATVQEEGYVNLHNLV